VQAATVLAYGLALALTIGTVLVYVAAGLVDSSRGIDEPNPPEWILYPNPFVMVADVVGADNDPFGASSSPFDPIDDWLARDEARVVDDGPAVLGADGEFVRFDEFGNPVVAGDRRFSSFWPVSATLLAALAVGAVAAGTRRLRTPAAVER
jgi:hypothetical protein